MNAATATESPAGIEERLVTALAPALPIAEAVVAEPIDHTPSVPAEAVAVSATFVGSRSADLVLVIADGSLLTDAAGTEDAAMPTSDEPAALLRAQLVTVPVELALRLRPAPVSPATMLDLAVGDVIPLPHQQHRPLDLAVEGQIVAHAAIGVQSGHVACVVVDLEESE